MLLVGDRNDIRPVTYVCHLHPEVLFQNRWRKRTEVESSNPGGRGGGRGGGRDGGRGGCGYWLMSCFMFCWFCALTRFYWWRLGLVVACYSTPGLVVGWVTVYRRVNPLRL